MDNDVRVLRRQAGWTQAEVAAAIGLSRQSIIAIEQGKFDPSLPVALDLAALFGVPVERLFHHQSAVTTPTPAGNRRYLI